MEFFYIQNRKTCLSNKILYQCLYQCVHSFLNFMLGFRFSTKSYTERRLKEKTNKHFLKTTEVLLKLMDMCLPNFDTYQGTVAPNLFKSYANSRYPDFCQNKFCLMSGRKFILLDVTSFLLDNLSGL